MNHNFYEKTSQTMKVFRDKGYLLGYISHVGNNPHHQTNDDVVDFVFSPSKSRIKNVYSCRWRWL